MRIVTAVGCLFGLMVGCGAHAGIQGSLANLNASDWAADDQYGWSVAVSGTLALVGSRYDNDGGISSGSVYVYDLTNPALPVEVSKLVASDAAAGDLFGWSVAISGSLAVVGATSNDDNGQETGSVYVFDLTNPAIPMEVSKIVASDGVANDFFGSSVAISGSIAVVGSDNDGDSMAAGSGSAYVYDLATPASPVEASKLVSSDADSGDRFGTSVAISGFLAVVGAPVDDDNGSFSGSAYVFDLSSPAAPIEESKILASDGEANDVFGDRVAISGSLAVVSANGDTDNGFQSGSVYVYDLTSPASPVEASKLLASDGEAGDVFGRAVAISGSLAVVGAESDSDKGLSSGGAYLYDLTDPANPDEFSKLLASNGAGNDRFGTSVGISGSVVVCGAQQSSAVANHAGSAYVFAGVDDDIACAGDGNGDGVIDVNDISYVLFRLGTVCP